MPAAVVEVLVRALDPEPRRRYGTAEELLAAIDTAAAAVHSRASADDGATGTPALCGLILCVFVGCVGTWTICTCASGVCLRVQMCDYLCILHSSRALRAWDFSVVVFAVYPFWHNVAACVCLCNRPSRVPLSVPASL